MIETSNQGPLKPLYRSDTSASNFPAADIHSNSPLRLAGSGNGCGDMTLDGEIRRGHRPTTIGAVPKDGRMGKNRPVPK